MTDITTCRACSGASLVLVTGITRPAIFIDGGVPAVMNRSEAFFSTINCNRALKSMSSPSAVLAEHLPVNRPLLRVLLADQTLPNQVLQALIQSLHTDLLPGLDGGVHLRDLVFANQVTDGGRADHDLVRCDPTAADLLEQRLRDHRSQRFREHGTHHGFFRGWEHVDDAVDGFGS